MTDWSRISREVIERVTSTFPETMPLKERKAAIERAYPFGPRAYWPRRAWCKARKAYLQHYNEAGELIRPHKPTGLEHLPRDPATGRPVIQ
jgi:hypothetical protein